MKKPPSTPQERSNLARKAAQARWSQHRLAQVDSGVPACPPDYPLSLPGRGQGEGKRRKLKRPKSKYSSWLDDRFCLHLYQDTAGAWWLYTPAGLDLPATHSEISLWLDLEALRFQISSYENLIIS